MQLNSVMVISRKGDVNVFHWLVLWSHILPDLSHQRRILIKQILCPIPQTKLMLCPPRSLNTNVKRYFGCMQRCLPPQAKFCQVCVLTCCHTTGCVIHIRTNVVIFSAVCQNQNKQDQYLFTFINGFLLWSKHIYSTKTPLTSITFNRLRDRLEAQLTISLSLLPPTSQMAGFMILYFLIKSGNRFPFGPRAPFRCRRRNVVFALAFSGARSSWYRFDIMLGM